MRLRTLRGDPNFPDNMCHPSWGNPLNSSNIIFTLEGLQHKEMWEGVKVESCILHH